MEKEDQERHARLAIRECIDLVDDDPRGANGPAVAEKSEWCLATDPRFGQSDEIDDLHEHIKGVQVVMLKDKDGQRCAEYARRDGPWWVRLFKREDDIIPRMVMRAIEEGQIEPLEGN
ncbi:hypothetical protein LCGC14_1962790 [marine sediment metagenome]|uniref:Uncharacterized protein n=1 Tax=marine sediment metagenome TaxID=412755 RepID=A0A0F9FED8_9ZZZZ